VKDAEGVLEAVLEIWEAQGKRRGILPSNLDHDPLALNELGASGKRDNGIKREDKPDESARIPPAPQETEQDSIEREQQRERQWQFLCENNVVECPDGTRPKRVLYRGTVCGHEAGHHKGLSTARVGGTSAYERRRTGGSEMSAPWIRGATPRAH
jgi:hypothetical protein